MLADVRWVGFLPPKKMSPVIVLCEYNVGFSKHHRLVLYYRQLNLHFYIKKSSDHSTTDDDDDDDGDGDETNDETGQGQASNVSIVPIDLGPTDASNIR